jgi:2'-5' RNA ligase
MGAFPGKSVRVVWLGLQGNFEELQKQVEEALIPFGFESEERKFTPHLTLGRVARPNPETSKLISAKISKLSEIQIGEFTVDRFHLKKSTLTPGGPIYEDLTEFAL